MPARRFPSELPLQRRVATIAREAINPDARTVNLTFSTGAAVRRNRYQGWDGPAIPFDEILVVSREAVALERLNSGAPVLDSHQSWSTESQVAVVERAWIEGRGGGAEARATVRFPTAGVDEAADRIFNLIADGIIRNVSCGYMINDVEVIPANDKRGTVEVHKVTRWTPYEVSFVSMGADANAQVRTPPANAAGSNAAESLYPVTFTPGAASPEDDQMNREQQITEACRAAGFDNLAAGYIAGALSVEAVRAELAIKVAERSAEAERVRVAEAARQQSQQNTATATAVEQARLAERTRIAEINTACRDFGFADRAEAFISGSSNIDQVRAALQAALAERNAATAPRTRGTAASPTGGQDERETRLRLMENALAHRLNPRLALEEGARQYRGMRMLDMARECLEAEGVKVRGMTPFEIASAATASGGSQFAYRAAGLHSTSDFPIILGNTVNRTLREAYELAPSTYKRIASRSIASDFRPLIRATVSDSPRLEKVNQSGEFKYGTINENSESYRLLTYGRIFAVTRQLLVNDDLGAFQRIPGGWGRAAAALENEIVWALVTANAQMADGNNLFSAAHGNLAADNESIDVDSVGLGRLAMRLQRSLDPAAPDGEQGYLLNLVPNILAVPAALELIALQFLSPIVVPNADSSVNPYKGTMQALTEPLLDADDANAWYLMAENSGSIEYAFLEGNDGVFTDQRIGFEVDGMEFKARLDFGAGLQDYRGMYKNNGEAAS